MVFFSAVGGRFTITVIIDIIVIIMIVVIINMIVIIIIIIIIFIIVIIMMNDIGIDKKHQLYIIKKMINIAIRATYYIFCCRNRNWDSPDFFSFFCFCVVLFCVVFVLFLFLFCFVFFSFNHPISSSICELPICGEIYNCTFKKTNKASIIIIFMIIISISIIVYQPPKCDEIRNIKSTKIRGFRWGVGFFFRTFLSCTEYYCCFLIF